jgi:murein DD-endopeptidase MepM/ murein hydrolase activator NlpD
VVALAAGCAVEQDDGRTVRVDTVVRTDTVLRTDTIVIVDTVVALGDASDPPLGPAARDSLARTVSPSGPVAVAAADLAYLRGRRLLIPVAGVPAARIPDTFDEMRGTRQHAALDILAPRGTPVLSTDDGRLAKLHQSIGGGITAYAEDPSGRFIYYYAHLDRYRPGIAEGMTLARGDTIGFVGTTGNAPPTVPHLHFAIARMDADRKWWKGTPIDPRPFLVPSGATR